MDEEIEGRLVVVEEEEEEIDVVHGDDDNDKEDKGMNENKGIDEDKEDEVVVGDKEVVVDNDKEVSCSSSRMTLRKPQQSNVTFAVPSLPPEVPSSSSSSTPSTCSNLQRITWPLSDAMVFYDAIKQYGKDFKAASEYMRKRNRDKDKEKVKNYYYNTYKYHRIIAGIQEEDWDSEVPRDARELFTVMGGLEWRKRTDSNKFDSAKLKQLIFKGYAETRFRGKKQPGLIRIPVCPSLMQFFDFQRRIDKFPNEVTMYLSPSRVSDESFVLSRGQNPRLCLKLNMSERVDRIFQLLHLKWGKHKGGHEICPFMCKLVVTEDTKTGDVVYAPSMTSNGYLSVNKLLEDRKAAADYMKFKKGGEYEIEKPGYNIVQSIIPHLSLNRSMIRMGLNERNIKDASVAELYALCNMSQELKFMYSIEEELDVINDIRDEESDPWDVLVDLLSRGYGEVLNDPSSKSDTIHKNNSIDVLSVCDEPMQMDTTPVVETVRVRRKSRTVSTKAIDTTNRKIRTSTPIIDLEMEAFQEQLNDLNKEKVKEQMERANRRKERIKRPKIESDGSSMRTPQPSQLTNHEYNNGMIRNDRPSSSSSPSSSNQTDFSHMHSNGDDPIAIALRAGLISPAKNEVIRSTPMAKPNEVINEGEGEITKLVGMLEPSTRYMDGSSSSIHPSSSSSHQPNQLPHDVCISMEHMMNTNSIDFIRTFDQLVHHTQSDSPTKLSQL